MLRLFACAIHSENGLVSSWIGGVADPCCESRTECRHDYESGARCTHGTGWSDSRDLESLRNFAGSEVRLTHSLARAIGVADRVRGRLLSTARRSEKKISRVGL